jgi:NAD(P)-dependent dehydrogenase (short-subunit alcohol dehydrogenase family)
VLTSAAYKVFPDAVTFLDREHTVIDPKEIADVVTYVSSPLASVINGAALRVDGGLNAGCFELRGRGATKP